MTVRLAVTALGSCRIVNPMRLGSDAGAVHLNNADVYGYVHTPAEVIQLLDYLKGMDVPEPVVPYVAGSRTVPPRTRRTESDVYVIEISSLKSIVFHGWNLQLNYFAERLRPFPDLRRSFFEAPLQEQRNRRAMELVRLPDFMALPTYDRRVLVDAHVVNVTREDLRTGVLAVVERLAKPVLFVTHLDLPDPRGNKIESRSLICAWMAELAQEFGIMVFDPTPHVLQFGIDRALAENGQSRSHYSGAFERVLAEALQEEMHRACAVSFPHVFLPVAAASRDFDFQVDCARARTEALELIRAGDLAGATALARAAIAQEPPCGRAMSIIAQAALRAGDASAALNFALQARAADATERSAIAVAAKALTKLHRYQAAAELWEEVSAARPGSVRPLVEGARCRLRAKAPQAALELISKGLLLEPGDVLALAVKAEALHMLGRWSDLVAVGIALASSAPDAAVAVLQWLFAANETRGLACIAEAIRNSRTPASSVPVDLASKLCMAADEAAGDRRWQAAGECLRAARALDPRNERAGTLLSRILGSWMEKAHSLIRSGALADAMAVYDVSLQIDPYHGRALREAAMVAEQQSAWDRASDLWMRCCEGKSAPSLLVRTARATELAGREHEALELYCRALAADPTQTAALAARKSLARRLGKMARSLEVQGDIEAAAELAAAVLRASPEDPVCAKIIRRQSARLIKLLRQAMHEGDESRQESLANDLLRLDPRRSEALKVLSTARMRAGHFGEAADLLRQLASIQTDVAAHWVKLGRCLRLMRKHEEAREAAHEALARDPANRAAHKILADLGLRDLDRRGAGQPA